MDNTTQILDGIRELVSHPYPFFTLDTRSTGVSFVRQHTSHVTRHMKYFQKMRRSLDSRSPWYDDDTNIVMKGKDNRSHPLAMTV